MQFSEDWSSEPKSALFPGERNSDPPYVPPSGGKSHLRKTQRKLEPSPETKAIIQASSVWKVESEFYRFAEQQFNFIKQKTMAAVPGGRLRPRPRAYHYEKIRPSKPK